MLANGKSFRSSVKSHIIQHHSKKFTVFAELEIDGAQVRCGLEKSNESNARLHIDGEKCRSIAKASELLPIILIDPHSYDLIEEGPSFRRHYLDWLLFHVKQGYSKVAQEYALCLRQRNSSLKQKQSKSVCQTWDPQLISLARIITEYRQVLLEELKPLYQAIIQTLHFPVDVSLSYYQGWEDASEFSDTLAATYFKDQVVGYTSIGPQRADVRLRVDSIPASDVLSRGQSKLAIAALLLAQGQYYQAVKGNSPIYFIDDLASELDQQNRQKLYTLLESIDGQILVTATERTLFPDIQGVNDKLFHVKQGTVSVDQSCV